MKISVGSDILVFLFGEFVVIAVFLALRLRFFRFFGLVVTPIVVFALLGTVVTFGFVALALFRLGGKIVVEPAVFIVFAGFLGSIAKLQCTTLAAVKLLFLAVLFALLLTLFLALFFAFGGIVLLGLGNF